MNEEKPQDLAGAQFAAHQHLLTVKAQATIIASQAGEITALTEANKLLAAQVAGNGGSTDWRIYHSALSQCADLLDNMADNDALVDTPKYLALKLASAQEVSVAGSGELSMDQVKAIRSAIKYGDGWDGDQWDHALANAIAAKVSARAADAPSEPSEQKTEDVRIANLVEGDFIMEGGTFRKISNLSRTFSTLEFDIHGVSERDSRRLIHAVTRTAAVKSRAADALDSQPAVPDGWVLVPISPTLRMTEAGRDARLNGATNMDSLVQWRAMLAAAPVNSKPTERMLCRADGSPSGVVVSSQPTDGEVRNG